MAIISNNQIGPGSSFNGRLRVEGALRIDGKYESPTLEADTLVIGKTGKIKSKITASSIHVEGVVIGSLSASTRVVLMPTARILGDINTPELIIQNGVQFQGNCHISKNGESSLNQEIEDLYLKD
jgi:cytoskeletal protein CcmA (bactofilin family)